MDQTVAPARESPETESSGSELSPRAFAWLVALAALVAALPILAVEILPFVDYPNHLARIAILRDLDGPLGLYFRANLKLLPNLGMDALMLALSAVLPVERAGQMAVVVVAVLWVTGAARLHAALHGTRSPWALAGGLTLYTLPLVFGFLNFVLGVALALHVLASWITARVGVGRILWGTLAGFVLLLCHLLGLGFVALLAPVLDRIAGRSWKTALGSALAFAPALVAYLLLSPRASSTAILPSNFGLKRLQLVTTFITGHPKFDLAFVGAAILVLGGLLLLRRGAVKPALLLPVGAFLLFWLALPFGIAGTANLDGRFPAIALLFALLAVGPSRDPRRVPALRSVAALLGGLLLLRSATLAAAYRRDSAELDGVRRAVGRLPEGAVVVPIRDERALVWDAFGWRPPIVYAAHLATLDGHYVAGTFDEPAQQPIVLREGWEGISEYRATRDVAGGVRALRADVARLARPPENVWVYAVEPAPNGRSVWRLFPLRDARR